MVEDEESVLEVAVRVLESQGYQVLTASDGQKALELIVMHPGKIDLIFTDVRMPVCNGPRFVHEARQIRSDFKVLYTSGFSWSSEQDHFAGYEEEHAVELLEKPYSPFDLAFRVRETLDE